jgi:Haem-degrading
LVRNAAARVGLCAVGSYSAIARSKWSSDLELAAVERHEAQRTMRGKANGRVPGAPIKVGNADKVVGGLGVSGDTSCADHQIAWPLRKNLGLDHLKGVGGVNGDADRPDNIIYDILSGGTAGAIGVSPSGFGHPTCLNTADPTTLPKVAP